jgi:hypothetical protein
MQKQHEMVRWKTYLPPLPCPPKSESNKNRKEQSFIALKLCSFINLKHKKYPVKQNNFDNYNNYIYVYPKKLMGDGLGESC